MQDVADPFSSQAQRVLGVGLAALLLLILELGFAIFAAPAAMLVWPLALTAAALLAVRRDIAHVRRYGWWKPEGESGEDGNRGPDGPRPSAPPGEPTDPDEWARFERELWAHIDSRQPERVG